jgi:hypothetical protein
MLNKIEEGDCLIRERCGKGTSIPNNEIIKNSKKRQEERRKQCCGTGTGTVGTVTF